jgi:prepilin-type N-terminal cleavage/methylation domain-containing protein
MKRTAGAFSLPEVLITIAVIGILAAAAGWTVSRVVGAKRDQKLESDQATLNRAVKAFVATGGSLEGLQTPTEVLAALKRSASSGSRTVGLAGSTVDPRLNLVMQTSDQARSGQARLYWHSGRQRF